MIKNLFDFDFEHVFLQTNFFHRFRPAEPSQAQARGPSEAKRGWAVRVCVHVCGVCVFRKRYLKKRSEGNFSLRYQCVFFGVLGGPLVEVDVLVGRTLLCLCLVHSFGSSICFASTGCL